MELARLGEYIHAQHAVVFRQSASNGNATLLVAHQLDAAHHGACGLSVLVGLVQRVVRPEGLVGLAAVVFQPFADGSVKPFVAVRFEQVVQVFQRQAGELHFFNHAALGLQAFGLGVDGVLMHRPAIAPLRRA